LAKHPHFTQNAPNTNGALAYNLEPMKQELVNGLIGRHYPLKPHHRAMMGCSGFLIVVAAFCLHTGLFSNRHYLAFGLVVIPSVLIMAAAVCEAMGKDGWYRKPLLRTFGKIYLRIS
jgi:hypothetical protein